MSIPYPHPPEHVVPRPLADRVLLEPLLPAKPFSSFRATEESIPGPFIGRVRAIGPRVAEVKVDDTVWFGRYAGVDLQIGSVEYVCIREDEIVAVAGKKES